MTIKLFYFLFYTDTTSPDIYTLSLHDALPIWCCIEHAGELAGCRPRARCRDYTDGRHSFWCWQDRKSTRLNSSHANISYAVFCLKKKKYINIICLSL